MALIVHVLLVAGIMSSGVTALIAAILAYTRRTNAPPVEATHYRFAIRVFWIGFALSVVGFALFFASFIGMAMTGAEASQTAASGVSASSVTATGSAQSTDVSPDIFFWSFAPAMAGILLIILAQFGGFAAGLFGLIKLGSGQPIGAISAQATSGDRHG